MSRTDRSEELNRVLLKELELLRATSENMVLLAALTTNIRNLDSANPLYT